MNIRAIFWYVQAPVWMFLWVFQKQDFMLIWTCSCLILGELARILEILEKEHKRR